VPTVGSGSVADAVVTVADPVETSPVPTGARLARPT